MATTYALETPSADPFDATIFYDRNRKNLDRHPTYILAAYVAGASGGPR